MCEKCFDTLKLNRIDVAHEYNERTDRETDRTALAWVALTAF